MLWLALLNFSSSSTSLAHREANKNQFKSSNNTDSNIKHDINSSSAFRAFGVTMWQLVELDEHVYIVACAVDRSFYFVNSSTCFFFCIYILLLFRKNTEGFDYLSAGQSSSSCDFSSTLICAKRILEYQLQMISGDNTDNIAHERKKFIIYICKVYLCVEPCSRSGICHAHHEAQQGCCKHCFFNSESTSKKLVHI